MASVKALYSYSYQYDGAEISFVQGDEFKLLSKASKEWWHVRRWREGVAQDIYVPANYVAEVEEAPVADENPTYENLEEVQQRQRQAKKEKAERPVPKPQPAVTAPEEDSSDSTYAVVGPRRAQVSNDKESTTESHGAEDQARPNEYDHLVSVSESASSSSKQGGYVQTGSAPPGADGYSEPSVVVPMRQNSSKKETQPTAQPPHVALKPGAGAAEDKVKQPQGGTKSISEGWMPGYALPATTAMKTRSLTTAASKEGEGEGGSSASLERFTRASTPERAASVRRPGGGPAVRPKVLTRPMSMHMESLPTAVTVAVEGESGASVSTPKSSDTLSSNMTSLKMALEQKLLANSGKGAGGGAMGGSMGAAGEPSGGGGGGRQAPPPVVPKPNKVPLNISAELANKLNRIVSVPPTTGGGGEDGKAGSTANRLEKTPSPDEKVGVV